MGREEERLAHWVTGDRVVVRRSCVFHVFYWCRCVSRSGGRDEWDCWRRVSRLGMVMVQLWGHMANVGLDRRTMMSEVIQHKRQVAGSPLIV